MMPLKIVGWFLLGMLFSVPAFAIDASKDIGPVYVFLFPAEEAVDLDQGEGGGALKFDALKEKPEFQGGRLARACYSPEIGASEVLLKISRLGKTDLSLLEQGLRRHPSEYYVARFPPGRNLPVVDVFKITFELDDLNRKYSARLEPVCDLQDAMKQRVLDRFRQELGSTSVRTSNPDPVDEMEGRVAGVIRTFGEIPMAWCPPGVFMMGSPSDEAGRESDEGQYEATISRGFWMAVTEVTQKQWKVVTGEYIPEVKRIGRTFDSTYVEAAGVGDTVAMYFTTWEDAIRWIDKSNATNSLPKGWRWSLPSEAQWEYACRAGGDSATYHGPMKILGELNAPVLDEIAWYGGNSSVGFDGKGVDTKDWAEKQYPGGVAGVREVGLKKANAWGLCDMIGNVSEWCSDWYGSYPEGKAIDPRGANAGEFRVFRGGNWRSAAKDCRAASRSGETTPWISEIGFRPIIEKTE
ncbi:MAG: SUMF1/EgtB/PvdO family nonheme iron enzyme [Verrucomicrobiae bacterium]|nr:SUMF1/EgtB/PvdO family nonheme iron enzyme [Verrucomicrobiae bacterium]